MDRSRPQSGIIRLWDAATGEPLGVHRGKPAYLSPDGRNIFPYLSPDGRTVFRVEETFGPNSTIGSDSSGTTYGLYELFTGETIGTSLPNSAPVEAVAFSRDGQTLLTASGDDGNVRIWDLADGATRGTILASYELSESRRSLTSPDRKSWVDVDGSPKGTARLWDAASQQPFGAPMHHAGAIMASVFSPDGKTLVTGSVDRTARAWDAASGQPIGPPLPHPGPVMAVACSPDGWTVLTGWRDKMARLWDAGLGRLVGPPLPHPAVVIAVEFAPDGRFIITKSEDRVVRRWELAAPPAGDAEQITLWTQVITGQELDATGLARFLDPQTWDLRYKQLHPKASSEPVMRNQPGDTEHPM